MTPQTPPLAQLRDAVADMRHAQREYFRTHSATALAAAKKAERRVDKLLAESYDNTLF